MECRRRHHRVRIRTIPNLLYPSAMQANLSQTSRP